ncbi:TPA: transposase family protein, partial [Pseudomonas aeruginosa]|nr:transposase family protein [Pseudomonas aeruginosa]
MEIENYSLGTVKPASELPLNLRRLSRMESLLEVGTPWPPRGRPVSESLSLLHPLKVEIVEFLEDDHDLQIKVEFPAPEFCTACGAISQSIRFSKKLTKYVDLPIRGKRTVLWGMRRRYKCKTCSKVFSPALLDFDEKHRMTKRCHAYVIKQAMTSTNSAVARDLGVDESVVRRALRDYCAEQ